MRKLDRSTIVSLSLIGLILVLILGVALSRRGDEAQDRLTANEISQSGGTLDEAERRCASRKSYDLIKRELFRRAAEMRGTDQGAFDRLAVAASVRMEAPVMTAREAELGTVSCSGHLSLDLPPGIAVVGGRRTLQAGVDYRLQRAADDSGDILILEGADAILVPLATLAQIDSPRAQFQPPAGSVAPTTPASPDIQQSPAPSEPVEAVARPSFNCRMARTRGEVAVCGDVELASLDRQMAAQYGLAFSAADPQRRQWLRTTRDAFLRYRDGCGSTECIAKSYRGRMREIDDIMSGRWRPGR